MATQKQGGLLLRLVFRAGLRYARNGRASGGQPHNRAVTAVVLVSKVRRHCPDVISVRPRKRLPRRAHLLQNAVVTRRPAPRPATHLAARHFCFHPSSCYARNTPPAYVGPSVIASPTRKGSPTDPIFPGAEFRKIQRVSFSRSGNPKRLIAICNQELTTWGTSPVPTRIVSRAVISAIRPGLDWISSCWSLCPCRFAGHR
jgi:hypothetical protein